MSRWQADEARGSLEGGRFALCWPALGAVVELEVVNARERERLVLRRGNSMMEMRLEQNKVVVTHTGVPEQEADGLASSWRASLSQLEHYLRHHPGEDRMVYWFAKTIRTAPQAAFAFFTEPEALMVWLARSGGVTAEGEPVSLVLKTGHPLTGRVLARADGRDVLLSWTEQSEATLMMRTLPGLAPGERLVAIAMSTWRNREPELALLQGLEASVDRLALALRSGGDA